MEVNVENTHMLGEWAEAVARAHLIAHGWVVYIHPGGGAPVDMIAWHPWDGATRFIDVKTIHDSGARGMVKLSPSNMKDDRLCYVSVVKETGKVSWERYPIDEAYKRLAKLPSEDLL